MVEFWQIAFAVVCVAIVVAGRWLPPSETSLGGLGGLVLLLGVVLAAAGIGWNVPRWIAMQSLYSYGPPEMSVVGRVTQVVSAAALGFSAWRYFAHILLLAGGVLILALLWWIVTSVFGYIAVG